MCTTRLIIADSGVVQYQSYLRARIEGRRFVWNALGISVCVGSWKRGGHAKLVPTTHRCFEQVCFHFRIQRFASGSWA